MWPGHQGLIISLGSSAEERGLGTAGLKGDYEANHSVLKTVFEIQNLVME